MKISVVIPCYKVKAHIEEVIAAIGPVVDKIYAVDDGCPEGSGAFIEQACKDPRVVVLYNPKNMGVGGAIKTGYQQAMHDGMDIAVKLDGDGQMDPALIPELVAPIVRGQADYCKGNRFHSWRHVKSMPRVRLIGNGALSFLNKISSGYWGVSDPTNGYTAVATSILKYLNFDGIADRYFFESDMLYHLYLERAVVTDMPMAAVYGDEESHLNPWGSIAPFALSHMRNTFKRIFYTYFLRDFSVATFELVFGLLLTSFGAVFGLYHWVLSAMTGATASTGTVMLAALPLILGFQLLLSFLHFDLRQISSFVPQRGRGIPSFGDKF